MKLTNWVLVSGLGMTFVGCGGGTGGGSFTSSVPATKTASAVTPAEAKQLCIDVINYYNGQFSPAVQKSMGCKLSGLIAGALAPAGMQPTVCQAAIDDCNKNTPVNPPTNPTTECADATPPSAACTITVGEYNACITDQVAAFNAAIAALPTCASLANPSTTPPVTEPATPASCKVVEQKCPEINLPGSGQTTTNIQQ